MNLDSLYKIAEEEDIEIMETACPESGSMSIMTDDGNCYIGIDDRIRDKPEKLVRVAHELGHCKTGAFYNRYSKFNIISKLEYKADKWSILELLPLEKIKKASRKGIFEPWELAEYFNLPQSFVEKALDFYRNVTIT